MNFKLKEENDYAHSSQVDSERELDLKKYLYDSRNSYQFDQKVLKK